ncbi:TrbM/KikA/MpfK family conjugal transfer protein [Mesorhizobium sp. J428]|uniref:TrbM/KikA/MpfK family conjugal transfer protein n=1 Tax=Mesorhizobium sp. J428 TaxID=2898440 RepID=UPI002150C3F8|nr:TrbM/KikA/MpfK family conjugal transfer protein [Mesorhizobium sp. J428]MCR5860135.1 conjugal transfer protein TrbM [Mesorhizobium sp. J428]MCR5860164.1 conjugal transfer protein TrbM [Mesorhizobium sp. J428]MCR5860199.1 conjugal transfer protein TrbM [Mesorhizobium sp. J428]
MKTVIGTLLALAIAIAGLASPAKAEGMFTGDTKLACEAILCLSTGQQPSECAPSIRRYFSIDARRISDTIKARKNFLNLCPSASQDDNMRSLVDSIANGAGRCDAAALNASMRVWRPRDDDRPTYIRNTLPSHCAAYGSHGYTDHTNGTVARYVGDPNNGGFWVDAADYDAALARYNAELRNRSQNTGGNAGGVYWLGGGH